MTPRIEVVTNEARWGIPSFTVTVGGKPVAEFGSQRAAIAHSAILTMRRQARDRREATR